MYKSDNGKYWVFQMSDGTYQEIPVGAEESGNPYTVKSGGTWGNGDGTGYAKATGLGKDNTPSGYYSGPGPSSSGGGGGDTDPKGKKGKNPLAPGSIGGHEGGGHGIGGGNLPPPRKPSPPVQHDGGLVGSHGLGGLGVEGSGTGKGGGRNPYVSHDGAQVGANGAGGFGGLGREGSGYNSERTTGQGNLSRNNGTQHGNFFGNVADSMSGTIGRFSNDFLDDVGGSVSHGGHKGNNPLAINDQAGQVPSENPPIETNSGPIDPLAGYGGAENNPSYNPGSILGGDPNRPGMV